MSLHDLHGHLRIVIQPEHLVASRALLEAIVRPDSPYWSFISRIEANYRCDQCEVTVVAVDKHGADVHECKRNLGKWLETVLDDPKQEKFRVHATVLV